MAMIAAALFLCLIIEETLRDMRAVSRLRGAWSQRVCCSLDDIYLTYYQQRESDRQMIQTVWKELALAFEVAPGCLRPEDRLDHLRDNIHLGLVTERVEEVMAHYLPFEARVFEFKTIDDLITAICCNWHQREWLDDARVSGHT